MLLDNLFSFGKTRIKSDLGPKNNYDNINKHYESNNLLDQNDRLTKLNLKNNNKSRVMLNNNNNNNNNNNDFFNNTLIRKRITETYYQSLEHHKRPRLVKKCGELNIHMDNVPKHKRRLLSDFFNTILDMKWRWHIVIFVLTFIISWFIFATVWYMIAFVHGDLNRTEKMVSVSSNYTLMNLENIKYLNKSLLLIGQVIKSYKNDESDHHFDQTLAELVRAQVELEPKSKPKPCVHGIHDFTSALLYSVETQHTIGYGLRYITEECKFAIIFLMFQSCFGIFVQGLVAGVVFAKISRPSKRKRTIIFSHNAVVSERDGKLCFMFKIGNIRTSQLSDARLRVSMIKSRQTKEGEFIPFQSYDMKVGLDSSGDNIFFPWPKTVEHIIDDNSPFNEICKPYFTEFKSNSSSESSTINKNSGYLIEGSDIRPEDYEIVVILEGNIETTGASCHIRTSYLPQEILFGYRFVPVYPKFTDFEYLFDYSKFDQIEPINLDLLSLNRAYLNKDLRVYDARKENKNYQLTLQNTIQADEKDSNKPASIISILNTFKAHADDGKQENTITTMVDDVENIVVGNKNGRFTVVPVSESKFDKRNSKQVAFEKSKFSHKHNRASSLPPINSHSLLEESNENDSK